MELCRRDIHPFWQEQNASLSDKRNSTGYTVPYGCPRNESLPYPIFRCSTEKFITKIVKDREEKRDNFQDRRNPLSYFYLPNTFMSSMPATLPLVTASVALPLSRKLGLASSPVTHHKKRGTAEKRSHANKLKAFTIVVVRVRKRLWAPEATPFFMHELMAILCILCYNRNGTEYKTQSEKLLKNAL